MEANATGGQVYPKTGNFLLILERILQFCGFAESTGKVVIRPPLAPSNRPVYTLNPPAFSKA